MLDTVSIASTHEESPQCEEKSTDATAFSLSHVPEKILKVEYAVRGIVAITADAMTVDGQQAFSKLLPCHIGNPHIVGMQPLSYLRDIVSLTSNPRLLCEVEANPQHHFFPASIMKRSRRIYNALGESGAYTHSQGALGLREIIADWFERRDHVRPSPKSIFMTNGASDGINLVLTCLIATPRCAVLLPMPQYPLYAATITRLGGTVVFYELDEDNQWAMKRKSVADAHQRAVEAGLEVKALVVITPGNPAPTLLSRDDISWTLSFSKQKGLTLIADEVYQENIYDSSRPFYPFRRVMHEDKIPTTLVSVHSSSKGFYGECGFRAGLIQIDNIHDDTHAILYKMKSVDLCPNTMGQAVMASVVDPPRPEEEDIYETYCREKDDILQSLQMKARYTTDFFNSLPGVSCQPIAAAMYAFPKIEFTEAHIERARKEGQSVELHYSLALLEKTGIITTPGDGFGQAEGTHHIRLTILPTFDDLKIALDNYRAFHVEYMACL